MIWVIIGCLFTSLISFIYIRNFMPLRAKFDGFEYVLVKDDGSVWELDKEDQEYLMEKFDSSDGARPYIKNRYNQLTPDGKIGGFILRKRVPKQIKINK